MIFPWKSYGLLMTLFDDMVRTCPSPCCKRAYALARLCRQYLVVFTAVAWIWAPGQQSFQYSLYSQVCSETADSFEASDWPALRFARLWETMGPPMRAPTKTAMSSSVRFMLARLTNLGSAAARARPLRRPWSEPQQGLSSSRRRTTLLLRLLPRQPPAAASQRRRMQRHPTLAPSCRRQRSRLRSEACLLVVTRRSATCHFRVNLNLKSRLNLSLALRLAVHPSR